MEQVVNKEEKARRGVVENMRRKTEKEGDIERVVGIQRRKKKENASLLRDPRSLPFTLAKPLPLRSRNSGGSSIRAIGGARRPGIGSDACQVARSKPGAGRIVLKGSSPSPMLSLLARPAAAASKASSVSGMHKLLMPHCCCRTSRLAAGPEPAVTSRCKEADGRVRMNRKYTR